MPLATEYRTQLDTPYADIVNSASRDGSLIKSAVFLSEFATRPWVHLDVAGTAWMPSDKATFPKGAVGVAVTTLVRLGLDFATGESATGEKVA
jgi:leucyl aminopeptidase